jgi:putative pyruvate formate lyase activating enzyme
MFGRPSEAENADSRFVVDPYEPSYLSLHRSGGLACRVQAALDGLRSCCACPRRCGVDRNAEDTGTCETGRYARVASAGPHLGEEACLSGLNGSGTIFFSHCNLRCVFCQNWDISQHAAGAERSAGEIAGLMIALQDHGCHNINFVSPGHVVPQVIEAVAEAARRGLSIPIVYNTNAYDSIESLRLLDGIVDVYMPDFKMWGSDTSRRYLTAGDYPERAREAVLEMHRQVGALCFGPDGIARRGVLVRHLVMPGMSAESRAIFEWLAREVSPDTFVNIMAQYRPANLVGNERCDGTIRFEELDRRPYPEEMSGAYRAAREAGLTRFDHIG